MPNTLVHLGVQTALTRAGLPKADIKWVWAGCILPDIPWLAQRFVRAFSTDMNAFDLRLYAVVQSSLFVTLILAVGLALLSRNPRGTFLILVVGVILHLLLDATQTKWANGVLLFAPFTWELLNFGLYWPESLTTHVLTGVSVACVIWVLFRERPIAARPFVSGLRWSGAAFCLCLYLALPLMFLDAAERSDVHFVSNLRNVEERPGSYIEIDRVSIEWRDGVPVARLSTGPELVLEGAIIPDTVRASVRGVFVNETTIKVTDFHPHAEGWRSYMNIFGLLVVLGWWAAALMMRRARR